eukprot:CAMPEP_0117540386 /NCGR_PEP_ID=MMETSP0784-20121206/43474_1 /TAXON_ID=39447 /ORGANISM="" /LENGTH=445 /DNA_ID=CAMNT_0005337043 /DNA_START=15 /DNA_END=1348 /DNA_ORIENTATION=+
MDEAGLSPDVAPTSPSNQKEWSSNTKATLSEAGATMRDLLKQLEVQEQNAVKEAELRLMSPKLQTAQNRSMQVRLGIGVPPRTAVNVAPGLVKKVHHNVGQTGDVSSRIDSRLQMLRDSTLRVEHAQRAKWAALKVCEWRLELRSKRPQQELFRDHLQAALEKEQNALQEARLQLTEMVKTQKQAAAVLEEVKVKMWTLRDRLNREGVAPPAKGSPVKSAPPADGGESPSPEGTPPPTQLPETQEQLIKRASKAMDAAVQLSRNAEAEVLRTTQTCADANAQVTASFKRRVVETEQLKRKLEDQIIEIDNAIAAGETSLNRIRARREAVGQSVADTPISQDCEATLALLEKLRAIRRGLEEDLRCKLASLKVDESCRRIPPHMTPAHSKPVSRDFNKIMRSMTMTSSLSSPNLTAMLESSDGATTSPVNARPPSPAGGSSSLKAA